MLGRLTMMKSSKTIILPCISIFIVLLINSTYAKKYQSRVSDNPFPIFKPESVGIESDTLNIFSDQIQEWLDEDEIVGAILTIIKSRKTVFHEAFGWREKEREIPMEKNTICRLRSMTKPFVGTSILMLSEQGKLALSDRVAKYFPSYKNEKCQNITIEQLITHTGGFKQPGYPWGPNFYKDLKSLVETIGKSGPSFAPGERYVYSDAGSSTLAYIVTEISEMPVEDFIQKNILDKLGMSNTFCNLTEDDPRRSAVSCTYSGGKGTWNKYWDNSSPQAVPYFRGSGGIYSTTTDYARFLAMWMDEGSAGSRQFLKSETVKQALTPSDLSKNGNGGYGFHWEIYKKSELVFGHRGSDGTLAIAAPQKDLMFLYFTQSRGNKTVSEMLYLFFDVFY